MTLLREAFLELISPATIIELGVLAGCFLVLIAWIA